MIVTNFGIKPNSTYFSQEEITKTNLLILNNTKKEIAKNSPFAAKVSYLEKWDYRIIFIDKLDTPPVKDKYLYVFINSLHNGPYIGSYDVRIYSSISKESESCKIWVSHSFEYCDSINIKKEEVIAILPEGTIIERTLHYIKDSHTPSYIICKDGAFQELDIQAAMIFIGEVCGEATRIEE